MAQRDFEMSSDFEISKRIPNRIANRIPKRIQKHFHILLERGPLSARAYKLERYKKI